MSYNNTSNNLKPFTEQVEPKRKFSLRENVIKYLSYLPLFIFCLVVAIGSALLYIRYKVPIYKASVQVLVNINQNQNSIQQDLIREAVSGVRPINLDNEMQLIRSKKLLERVIKNGNFNLTFSKEGNIKTYDAYKSVPFLFQMVSMKDTTQTIQLKINKLTDTGGEIDFLGTKKIFKWNDTVTFNQLTFIFAKNATSFYGLTDTYKIVWKPVRLAASEIQGNITVTSFGTKTSIIILSLTGENRKKCEDFLNAYVKEIIKSDVELKQETSVNTVDFIQSRLDIVAKEMGLVEDNFLDFRKKSRFLDILSESVYYQTRVSEAEKAVNNWNLEIGLLRLIEEYLNKNVPNGKTKLIPSNLSIDDLAFNGMIIKYNELQTKKEAQLPILTEDNSILMDLNNQLKETKTNILIAAANLIKAKELRIKTLQDRNTDDLGKLSQLPEKDKVTQDIQRQKAIKEKLFLYLLQKREETAIASISTTSNYQAMDVAGSSGVPIEPKTEQIKTFAIVFGLLIPILFIYLVDLLNDKVTVRHDITDKTDIPIVGEISHVDTGQSIVVENSRNIVAEQFRIFRSNLQFVLPKDDNKEAKTLLVTSSISGEGKSFISLNLACVLALSGKRVALLEFDLRKLKSITIPELENTENKGITNYLIGQNENIEGIYKTLKSYPTLNVFRTGPIPPNPAELIISNKMENLFAFLKANYDYIVIDSAPVGLVSDSFSLNKYADIVLYIVRQRYTFKKQLEFINDLKREGKLKNLALVINDVNLAGRYGYYGYGYGYGYGYMYKYGYGNNKYIYGGKKTDPYFNENKKGYFDSTEKISWWQRLFGK